MLLFFILKSWGLYQLLYRLSEAMLHKGTVTIVLCVVLVGLVSGGKKERGKERKKKPAEEEGLEGRVKTLEETMETLKANNVHFFFHGDDDHEHMDREDEQHVHVHVHVDGHDHHSEGDHAHHEHVATCRMSGSGVDGAVTIVQTDHDKYASFKFEFDDLWDAKKMYGIHVHRFGDLSDNCGNIGGHYDPYIDGIDVGDLGKLETGKKGGVAETWKNDTQLSLFGEHSIVGRSIAVHRDDAKTVICCAIVLSPDTHDHDIDHSHDHDHSAHDHDDHSAHAHHDHSAHAHH